MSEEEWEESTIQQGAFIGWGKLGQTVTGRVVDFTADGGRDFNGDPCPQVVLELTESCDNYKDKGATHETVAAGEFVTITAGQANLRRHLTTISPKPGDRLRVRYETDYKTPSGTGKEFRLKFARGAAQPAPVSTGPAIEDF
jgi:hypothetical protein